MGIMKNSMVKHTLLAAFALLATLSATAKITLHSSYSSLTFFCVPTNPA